MQCPRCNSISSVSTKVSQPFSNWNDFAAIRAILLILYGICCIWYYCYCSCAHRLHNFFFNRFETITKISLLCTPYMRKNNVANQANIAKSFNASVTLVSTAQCVRDTMRMNIQCTCINSDKALNMHKSKIGNIFFLKPWCMCVFILSIISRFGRAQF